MSGSCVPFISITPDRDTSNDAKFCASSRVIFGFATFLCLRQADSDFTLGGESEIQNNSDLPVL